MTYGMIRLECDFCGVYITKSAHFMSIDSGTLKSSYYVMCNNCFDKIIIKIKEVKRTH